MKETFAIPAAGAIISQEIGGAHCILLQERQKSDGGITNGLLEIPAGKIRAYENIYDALCREVWEETGLTVTEIAGEAQCRASSCGGFDTISFQPYCITQNLSGAYSLLLCTFLCHTEGVLLDSTDETAHLRWVPLDEARQMLQDRPEAFFPMHLNALRQYLA